MSKPKVTVVGSINMDLVVSASKMPAKGETLIGDGFHTYPGGKGANQAVAAARAGAEVTMIGAVGADSFGEELISDLEREGIDVSKVKKKQESPTGIATIILAENDNRIIVTPGANHTLTGGEIDDLHETIIHSDIVLFQLETPMEVVRHAADIARSAGVPVILNPAPYHPVPEALMEAVQYITPNETEAEALYEDHAEKSFKDKLIVTMGAEGIRYREGGHIEGHVVDAVDTTGAGDTFNGVLAAELASGHDLDVSIMFANAAAALAVQKIGAQSGMPHRDEVEQFLKDAR
ncbi:ribokinase [Salimicrobium sp. PL1-032A]|uniref:ribokinase n=1 Tax=Salimicrobium sp. PL1-032A TaxID=3095364 RepID=UPI003260E974